MDKEIHVWQIVDSNYLFTMWLTYLQLEVILKLQSLNKDYLTIARKIIVIKSVWRRNEFKKNVYMYIV